MQTQGLGAKSIGVFAGVMAACVAFFGCASGAPFTDPPTPLSLTNGQPTMSQSQIAVVQQTFPNFIPSEIAPGTVLGDGSGLVPSNFLPAKFFGEPSITGAETTPLGVSVQTNGYDGGVQPVFVADHGTFFDFQNNSFQFQLGPLDLVPLNKLESRMHVSFTPNSPILTVNRRSERVDLAEVDRILLSVQSSLALQLPAVAQVDVRNCRITLEPTIFYVQDSNFGSSWAGGSTHADGNGKYSLRLAVFYISNGRVIANWQMLLVDEAINFFVLSVGRPDLGI
ncbi:MAG: hypothetical protein GZ088_06930 [Acidipila sp.]|nr:hypothetical protein [Acidipila sp.]